MVRFYSSDYTFDYSFSAVALAYFLRYPNPYSRHVASTDTIDRSYDSVTQRLTTVRLHVKQSRLPPAVLKLLPKSSALVGSTEGEGKEGRAQSFILEKSVVDVREGWMETESRNLDWNNVLSVIERHTFRRPEEGAVDNLTNVHVDVTLKSRIGEQLRRRRQRWGTGAGDTGVVAENGGSVEVDEPPVKQGWFSSWSSSAIRAAVETISLQRTEKSQPKAQLGMGVVLDRLRTGGIQRVLEGMKDDRELAP
ncbi:hypothetical protein LTR56_008646 [Elasticomyces elasticus]|nr:hypothetical protein LTR56_008646 [Elasticomyces elasticus]KAK3662251.1 hypothetical protein LTR22_007016 [Elasticomyces elasticus]KAK4916724.1 hypothetical protein LTR49_015292 [Elasticomyces elasticus]KAK5768015.1 hypothetical protein LTS12_001832 [Elasticomyces elasticus]